MTAAAWRVLKFGGSSVGDPERLLRVLDIVERARAEGPVAVVVSAMGDTTDRLIEAAALAAKGDLAAAEAQIDRAADLASANGLLALQSSRVRSGSEVTSRVRELLGPLRLLLHGIHLLREQTPQTLDLVMSFGERLSAAVLTEALGARDLQPVLVDARAFTVTDDRFGNARVDEPETGRRLASLRGEWAGRLPVVTGFLGQTRDGRTTTLGRNGSDYTATLLARGLEASEVIRWTDVPGVMTADPSLVADALPLARLSYVEALELADFGASVFHPRTMIPLIESGIPLRIKSTARPEEAGTLIDRLGGADEGRATSVTSLENLALLGVQSRRVAVEAPVAGRVLRALEQAAVTVWMASESSHGQAVAVAIPQAQVARASAAIDAELQVERLRGDVEPVSVEQPVTLLTLVAEAMGQASNVAGRFFHALGAIGINVRAIAQGASSRSISCAVGAQDTSAAVRAVHAAFNFARQEVNLLVLGKGTVGGQLVEQVREQRATLAARHDVLLKVVGVVTRSAGTFEEAGLDLDRWRDALGKAGARPSLEDALDRLCRLPVPVLVDCTGAEGMEQVYAGALQRGIHVVTANKKPLAAPWQAREELFAQARRTHRTLGYETTVGAGLPVIETLKDLVRTGDTVELIEGSLSGTLGFLTAELMKGVALSAATRQAIELGFSEPNPQDDLSGVDVARKALILARELGLPLELSDVRVEPLVPAGLLEPTTPAELFTRLERHDATLAAEVERYRREGLTLRYLVRIEPSPGGKAVARVGPMPVADSHPAAKLRGPEAPVAFTTTRYREFPLVVQGAGAGGAVTAAGVLADVLKVARTLRGG